MFVISTSNIILVLDKNRPAGFSIVSKVLCTWMFVFEAPASRRDVAFEDMVHGNGKNQFSRSGDQVWDSFFTSIGSRGVVCPTC